jgi:hypothetical protein
VGEWVLQMVLDVLMKLKMPLIEIPEKLAQDVNRTPGEGVHLIKLKIQAQNF